MSLKRSKPEYIGVECSTSKRPPMFEEPFSNQITSISCKIDLTLSNSLGK
jgi:hypothetical protein